ncbi:MAG: MBL fold metallo-hydrolase [Acetobacteraceae bacterium]|nr:MAG: MBL fold metallo-hydrolase [Acetobacteraceae bacterium]
MLRIHEPHPGVLAFYEGRDGSRHAEGPNWVDDGALSLGIASYAVIAGDHALVYDCHLSPDRAKTIRAALVARGARQFTVILSHWHIDHVAGTEAFADCEIIANPRTLAHLTRERDALESGTYAGLPAISPLILPSRIFDGRLCLDLAGEAVELLTFDIHSDDGTVLWLPKRHLLLAGDTLEDCVTWVSEPDALPRHLPELARLAGLGAKAILPNHGSEAVIAAGGYGPGFITATSDYVAGLIAGTMPADLTEAISARVTSGDLTFFAPYQAVHLSNLAKAAEARAAGHWPAA